MIRVRLSLILLLLTPTAALADRCADLSNPSRFTAASAMEAIFCSYDRQHAGTLLPIEFTEGWQADRAEILATPLLVAEYKEHSHDKGVLVVSRQMLEDGKPMDSHAQGAALSVYVFEKKGTKWAYEKGRKYVVENAGSYGQAPPARLMRLGDHKYGLEFEQGFCNGGYCTGSVFIVPLSEPAFDIIGEFEMSGSNEGAGGAQWAFEGHIEALKAGASDDYLLRVVYDGTESVDVDGHDRVVPRRSPLCYRKGDREYQLLEEDLCSVQPTTALPKVFLYP